MLGIFAACLLPLPAAWWLESSVEESGVWATTNHGTFAASGTTLTGVGLDVPESGTPLWRLIMVPGAAGCQSECRQAFTTLRALHLRLGKDSARVQRIFVGTGAPEDAEKDVLAFASVSGPVALSRGLYIADPLGNVVLMYDWSQAGTPLYEDLEHLLDLSTIG